MILSNYLGFAVQQYWLGIEKDYQQLIITFATCFMEETCEALLEQDKTIGNINVSKMNFIVSSVVKLGRAITILFVSE